MKSRLQRWESASGVPLTIAASAFFVAFALPIIWYPGMPASVAALCDWVRTTLDSYRGGEHQPVDPGPMAPHFHVGEEPHSHDGLGPHTHDHPQDHHH